MLFPGLLLTSNQVVFRNKASRPYSLHLQGVYDKFQGQTSPSGIPGQDFRPDEAPGEPVPPGEERVYNWRISKRQGPAAKDFDCKTGAYYSNVNKARLSIFFLSTLRPLTSGVSRDSRGSKS